MVRAVQDVSAPGEQDEDDRKQDNHGQHVQDVVFPPFFADASLLGQEVVEHVACRDNRVGEANQTDSHGETLHVVRGVAHEQEALREHVIDIEEHDGCADERHHHDGRARIELAVDAEVPASNVYKSFETEHIIKTLSLTLSLKGRGNCFAGSWAVVC